jgi:homoaconitase/3-isopropylmalate dehydratase large subunit
MKINAVGDFRRHVSAKDLIIYIIGKISASGADYRAVEFSGPSICEMSLASRMVLTNLSMEMGAKVAFIAPDVMTIEYVKGRTDREFEPLVPDPDANYIEEMTIDVSTLTNMVACPHTVDNVKPVSEIAGTKIDQALIGSCTNGRLEDFSAASEILDGKKVASGVRLLVIPASRQVYLEAMQRGYLEIFVKAGGLVLNPGCGPCLGAHQGLLAPGEACISTTNRNFKGRMGSSESFIYLASPATVASSALTGVITVPDDVDKH